MERVTFYFCLALLGWNFPVWAASMPSTDSAISAASCATFDGSTGIAHFPAVDVGADIFEADIKLAAGSVLAFDLVLPNIRSVTSSPPSGVHSLFDIDLATNTQKVLVPCVLIPATPFSDAASWQVELLLVAGSNPARFTLGSATQLPYFAGITKYQISGNSATIEWEPNKTTSSTPDNIKYEIHSSTIPAFAPNDSTRKATLNNDAQSYILQGLQTGQDYYVLVIAVDANNKRSAERDYRKISISGPRRCSSPNFTAQTNTTAGVETLSNTISHCGADAQISLSGGLASLVVNGQDKGSNVTVRDGDAIAIKTTSPPIGSSLSLSLAVNGKSTATWNVNSAAIIQPKTVVGFVSGSTPVECSVGEAGGAQCSLPISAPPGTSGMVPKLALSYGQGGNGPLGLSWSLSGLSVISRCAATQDQEKTMTGTAFNDPVDFDDNDRFCLDGERLMAEPGVYGKDNTVYHTEQESFQKIVSYGVAGSGPEKFKVWTKAGLIMEYGFTADSRIEAQGKSDALVWALNRVTDTKGNYYAVSYQENNANGEYYPLQVDYTGNDATNLSPYASIRFFYEERSDITSGYKGGSLFSITKRLKRIETGIGYDLYRTYTLSYELGALSKHSKLVSIQECGIGGSECFIPTQFTWNAEEASFGKPTLALAQGSAGGGHIYSNSGTHEYYLDFNNDGFADRVWIPDGKSDWWLALGGKTGFQTPQLLLKQTTPAASSDWGRHQIFTDINKDYFPDLVVIPSGLGDIYVALSDGKTLQPLQKWLPAQSGGVNLYSHEGRYETWLDLNKDGYPDKVWLPSGKSDLWATYGTGTGFTEPKMLLASNIAGGKPPHSGNGWHESYADVNGDGNIDKIWVPNGLHDIWVALGNGTGGFNTPTEWLNRNASGINPYSSEGVYDNYFVDLNGDGLADFLWIPYGLNDLYVAYSTGAGFKTPERWMPASIPSVGQPYSYYAWHESIIDLNNDGFPDRVWVPHQGNGDLYVALSNSGKGFGTPQVWMKDTVDGIYNRSANGQRETYVDLDSDGIADKAWIPSGKNDLYVAKGVVSQSNSITSVTTGHGQKTTFTYKPLTDSSVYKKGTNAVYPEMDFIGSLYVVSSIATDNGIGGQRTLNYFYEGAKVHLQGRGFRGFSKTTITDDATGIQNITFYDRDYRNLSTKVKRTETRLADGRLIADSDNYSELVVQGYGVHFSRIKKSISRQYELDGSPVSTTVTDNSFDNYGNPTQVKTSQYEGLETTGTLKYTETTDNTYTNDVTKWFLGRLTRTQVNKNVTGQAVSSRVSSWEYDSTTGLMLKEIIEPNETALCLSKTYNYDAYGNILDSAQRPCNDSTVAPRTQRSEYDSQGRFTLRSINALNQSETKTYDGFGNLTALTGPNSLTTRWEYDGFGRKTLETRADGTWTQSAYRFCAVEDHCPTLAKYFVRTETSGGAPSFAYFDVHDREIRKAAPGFNPDPSYTIYSDVVYNARGEKEKVSEPYFVTETQPLWTTYEYDAVGRPIKQTAPDGSITTTLYQGLTTIVTNPLGQKNVQIKDVRDKVVQSIDNLGNSVITIFDNFGNPIQIGAYRNSVQLVTPTVIEYDKRGQKTRMSDPDTGITSYQYNVFGELISQTDAMNRTVKNEYDILGRLIKRTEPEGISTWEYDTAPRGIGKLAKVTGADGYTENTRYDVFGRGYESTVNIGGQNFVTTTQFDQYGRTAALTYPTGFASRNVYNTYGYLTETRDSKTNRSFWRAETMNARGQLEKASLGNGLETSKVYDKSTGRIQTIQTGTPSNNQSVQNLGFEFDKVGNLTERRKGSLWEAFTYDGLNRLTKSALSTGQSITQAYDYLGNITSKSDVGTYTYDAASKPHAVTKAGNVGYTYDAVGNRISATNGETIEYTSFNKPSKITKGTTVLEFQHTPSYNRYRQRVTEKGQLKDILYVGLLEQETVGGVTKFKHSVTAGSDNVALYTQDSSGNENTRYLHKDHLGSVDVITDESGNVVDNLSFDAWGRRRSATDWNALTEQQILDLAPKLSWRYGFTGHEHLDSVELVHMNGRIYDPIIGRFLSADPFIQEPNDLQSLNRYSYVLNNPLSLIDPTGYFSFGKIFKAIGNAVQSAINFVKENWKPIVAAIVGVALGAVTMGIGSAIFGAAAAGFGTLGGAILSGAGFGFGSSFAGSLLSGRSIGDSLLAGLKGGVIGGVTAGLTFGVGSIGIEGVAGFGVKTVAHGVVQGFSNMAQGGRFEHGFIAGAIAGGMEFGNARLSKLMDLSPKAQHLLGIMSSTISAGTAAEISGGKFINGAVSGAFIYLFNKMSHEAVGNLTDGALGLYNSFFGYFANQRNKQIFTDSITRINKSYQPGTKGTLTVTYSYIHDPGAEDAGIYFPRNIQSVDFYPKSSTGRGVLFDPNSSVWWGTQTENYTIPKR